MNNKDISKLYEPSEHFSELKETPKRAVHCKVKQVEACFDLGYALTSFTMSFSSELEKADDAQTNEDCAPVQALAPSSVGVPDVECKTKQIDGIITHVKAVYDKEYGY